MINTLKILLYGFKRWYNKLQKEYNDDKKEWQGFFLQDGEWKEFEGTTKDLQKVHQRIQATAKDDWEVMSFSPRKIKEKRTDGQIQSQTFSPKKEEEIKKT